VRIAEATVDSSGLHKPSEFCLLTFVTLNEVKGLMYEKKKSSTMSALSYEILRGVYPERKRKAQTNNKVKSFMTHYVSAPVGKFAGFPIAPSLQHSNTPFLP
jgi:hypothetical protein